MVGETELSVIIAALQPRLSQTAYAFCTVASPAEIPSSVSAIGTFAEDEGITLIVPFDQAERANLTHSGPWAKISLCVHSSLTAVGLTAIIATALSLHNISANVVAGYFHDHIFVPWTDGEAALQILNSLAAGSSSDLPRGPRSTGSSS